MYVNFFQKKYPRSKSLHIKLGGIFGISKEILFLSVTETALKVWNISHVTTIMYYTNKKFRIKSNKSFP